MGETVVNWERLEREFLGFEPLGSRLRPPRAQVALVPRRALVERLSSSTASLVLVAAPAGSGKTIGLAQWLRDDPRPSAWLQLDAADADPALLLSYLAAALSGVAPVDPQVFELLRQRHPPIRDRVLPSLGTSLEAAAPFVLVLDDAHLVDGAAAWDTVDFLLEQLPAGAQLAIGSRSRPPLPLARLRAAGRLAEFGMGDLAMDGDETRHLLGLHRREVSDGQLADLLETTEGWATALYLAILAGDGRPVDAWIGGLRGDQRDVAAYLTAEVLDHLPEHLRSFLVTTSVLDQLSAGLCRAVTLRDDAHLLLADLARDNLFVVALDDRDEWYRYHHLFQDLLQAHLRRETPESVRRELHARAAAWHHEHGDEESAVRHWLAAGQIEHAARPSMFVCQELVDRGQVARAKRLLDGFSEEQLGCSFPLTMTAAWLYGTVLGEPGKGERWIHHACSAPSPVGIIEDGAEWRGFQLGMRALLAPDGIEQMLRDAEESQRLYTGDGEDPYEAERVLGVAHYLAGHRRHAERHLTCVADRSAFPTIQAYALGFLTLLARDEHRWDDALATEQRASELCPQMALDISPGMFLATPIVLARAAVLAYTRDPGLDEARLVAERHLNRMVPQAPWRLILGAVVLGEVALGCGDLPDAQRWALDAERRLRTYPDAGMLAARAKQLRQALEHRRLTEPLTAAEQRVLGLLPTHLTSTQMAARLFITQNTVKSHLRRLYLKLGVTTRAEAVARATELGLLVDGSVETD